MYYRGKIARKESPKDVFNSYWKGELDESEFVINTKEIITAEEFIEHLENTVSIAKDYSDFLEEQIESLTERVKFGEKILFDLKNTGVRKIEVVAEESDDRIIFHVFIKRQNKRKKSEKSESSFANIINNLKNIAEEQEKALINILSNLTKNNDPSDPNVTVN